MTPAKLLKGELASLDEASMRKGLRQLAGRDDDLARVLRELGPPQMWAREPGFPTLVFIMLEQQVSLASARAVYERLAALVPQLTPESFLALDDSALRRVGFSRQKIKYTKNLAAQIVEGRLDLEALGRMEDDAVRTTLLGLKGIGPWTAEIYLLRALNRPDAWPAGDLALAVAVEEIKCLPARPRPVELEAIAEPWRPWRAVAARLLWHYYLHKPRRTKMGEMKER